MKLLPSQATAIVELMIGLYAVGVSAFGRVVLFFSLFFLYALASAKTKTY
jgi:hypothetical protein